MAIKPNYLEKELRTLVTSDPDIFQFIQRASLDGLWYWDLENPEHEWMNPGFWELLGYNPDEKEHLASEWMDIIFPDDLKLAEENLKKHCEDPNHPYDQVVRYHHRNGTTVWVRCRGIALRDGSGKAIRMFGAHTDLTPLMQAEESLQVLNERFTLAADSAGIGIWDLDLTHNILVWDERMLELYQIKEEEFEGAYQAWLARTLPDDRDRMHEEIELAIKGKKPLDCEFRIALPDGSLRYLKTSARVGFAEDGTPLRMTGTLQDVTREKELLEEVKRLASTDVLTGVGNRRHFMSRAAEEISRARRAGDPLSFFLLDIDFFKRINDTYGHDGGDKVLQELAHKCLEVLRTSDVFCRIGGEEFAALLPETDMDNAARIAERLRISIEQMVVISGDDKIQFTACMGLAQLKKNDTTAEEVLKRADKALYEAKESGRNRVVLSK